MHFALVYSKTKVSGGGTIAFTVGMCLPKCYQPLLKHMAFEFRVATHSGTQSLFCLHDGLVHG